MSLTFANLQTEVKRRATKDQAGTTFDSAIKTVINNSLFRISREAPWRSMRRKSFFNTLKKYTTGSGAGTFTNNSSTITVTGATFLTDGIKVGRRIKLSGDSLYHTIRTITSETSLTIEKNYNGTTTSTGTYSILGQEEYNLPIQAGHSCFMWHEEFGYPYKLGYLTDQDFYGNNILSVTEAVPLYYRMWGEDMIISQPTSASVMTISSSSSADTSVQITVFGVVSGYPDSEIITTNASNGTTTVNGSKSFSSVERVVKGTSTTGRITVTSNSANVTVAVFPTGNTTGGIMYKKVQLYPLPTTVFPINVQYYKDPYRLVSDGDVHELGQDFDEAIILLATSKMKGESEIDSGATTFFSYFKDEMATLRRTNMDKIDYFPTLRRPRRDTIDFASPNLLYRQVGAYYGPRVS